MRRPLRVLAALTVVGALALTACSDRSSEPTEVDEQRLAAIADAPPFDAAAYDAEWTPTPAEGAFRSLNSLANRGHLSFVADLPADASASGWSGLQGIAAAIVDESASNGWQLVGAACAPADELDDHAGSIVVAIAVELDDGSTAAGTVTVGGSREHVRADVYAAYHDEPDAPWDLAPVEAPPCVTTPEAPAVVADEVGTVGIDGIVLFPEDR